jgi:hypothetical protein
MIRGGIPRHRYRMAQRSTMAQLDTGRLGRRPLLKGAAVTGGLALAGLGGSSLITAPSAEAQTVGAQALAHPGMLHTPTDFAYIAAKIAAGAEPWTSGWNKLTANPHSQPGWVPRPVPTVIRGGTGQNYSLLYQDIAAAYQNAVNWRISGNTACRDTAVEICNAWSGTLVEVTGNADRFLAAGIYGFEFANAAELLRGAPGFDLGRFQAMLRDHFYPLSDDFLRNHNGACITNYWANWDLCNIAGILATGILCDDDAMIDQAIDYFWNGAGNGSISNAIPFFHDGGLAQWQESGRDQAHSMMGIGLMASIMEMAWNQGIDLYAANDNAFAKAAEYTARYNLGNDVPFTTYSWGTGQGCAYAEQTVISTGGRGHPRPVWAMIYGHYYSRRGLAMPNTAAMAAQVAPEGGGGDYGTTSGGFDALGFGTLLYPRDRVAVAANRIQSYNYQDRYVRHKNLSVLLDASISPAEDARFHVATGLADLADDCVSFESRNFPGYYLRHVGFTLKLEANDGSAQFAADATFRRVAGLADGAWTSFRSYNYPDRYLRHAAYVLRIDPITDAAGRADATFRSTT